MVRIRRQIEAIDRQIAARQSGPWDAGEAAPEVVDEATEGQREGPSMKAVRKVSELPRKRMPHSTILTAATSLASIASLARTYGRPILGRNIRIIP